MSINWCVSLNILKKNYKSKNRCLCLLEMKRGVSLFCYVADVFSKSDSIKLLCGNDKYIHKLFPTYNQHFEINPLFSNLKKIDSVNKPMPPRKVHYSNYWVLIKLLNISHRSDIFYSQLHKILLHQTSGKAFETFRNKPSASAHILKQKLLKYLKLNVLVWMMNILMIKSLKGLVNVKRQTFLRISPATVTCGFDLDSKQRRIIPAKFEAQIFLFVDLLMWNIDNVAHVLGAGPNLEN